MMLSPAEPCIRTSYSSSSSRLIEFSGPAVCASWQNRSAGVRTIRCDSGISGMLRVFSGRVFPPHINEPGTTCKGGLSGSCTTPGHGFSPRRRVEKSCGTRCSALSEYLPMRPQLRTASERGAGGYSPRPDRVMNTVEIAKGKHGQVLQGLGDSMPGDRCTGDTGNLHPLRT